MMKLKKFFTLLILTTFCCTMAFPIQQKEGEENGKGKNKSTKKTPFLKMMCEDEVDIWTSPFKIKKNDILKWVGTALIAGVLIANDEGIYRNIKTFQSNNKWVDDISPNITLLGDGRVGLGICGLFYLGGAIFKDKKAKETAKLSFMALLHASIVVQVIKHLAGRQRPSVDNGHDYWHGPEGLYKRYTDDGFAPYDAFPSGHTITAWSVATVVAEMYKETVYVPIICYTLATLAGLSRITEDTHWFSDVFIGAALGYSISKLIVKKRRTKISIVPLVGHKLSGIGITISF